jgi:micrococcal nuclease
MDGISNSPQPVKQLGGFDAPKPVAVAPIPGQTSAPKTLAKPSTDSVSVDLGSGNTTTTAKPVEIPKVQWAQPVTAVKAAGPALEGAGKAVVTYVGDGDSVSLKRSDGSGINCRIDSIDAPEVANQKRGKAGQAFGEESKRSLEAMILNKEVTVRITKPMVADKNYGRALCQIEIEGQNIDKTMLRDGAAWLYRRFNNNPELSALENDAKANKRGLWANPAAISPEVFRRMQQYGNSNSQ